MSIRDNYEDTTEDFKEFCLASGFFDEDDFIRTKCNKFYALAKVHVAYECWCKMYQCAYDTGYADGVLRRLEIKQRVFETSEIREKAPEQSPKMVLPDMFIQRASLLPEKRPGEYLIGVGAGDDGVCDWYSVPLSIPRKTFEKEARAVYANIAFQWTGDAP